VYWAVEVGEKVHSADYVSPPYMLTIEGTKKERTATLSHHLEPEDVATAFGLAPGSLPPRTGVGAVQPAPKVGAWWGAFGALALVGIVLMIAVVGHAGANAGGETVWGLVILGTLAIGPIAASSRRSSFELRRWDESDHPRRGGGDDDEGGGPVWRALSAMADDA
jgi:hypothetical protein